MGASSKPNRDILLATIAVVEQAREYLSEYRAFFPKDYSLKSCGDSLYQIAIDLMDRSELDEFRSFLKPVNPLK